ncbi:MAG: hypothetical protein RI907_761 [Pseudomonadota bacterium]|jgi:ribonuclease E
MGLTEAEAEAAAPVTATPAPVAPVAPAPAPVAEAAPAPAVARVEPFELPLGDLNALAQAAGLEWVNSDSAKISAAQAAIAAEPKAVHVPRERKPAVVLDDGPLILVETRKDLSQITLPFEQQAS